MTTDTDMLEANIKNLERENRELRMTLRDQFAMAALTSIAGSPWAESVTHKNIADWAYRQADEMMKARK